MSLEAQGFDRSIVEGPDRPLGHVTRATLSVLRFRQGRWRHIRVDVEPARP